MKASRESVPCSRVCPGNPAVFFVHYFTVPVFGVCALHDVSPRDLWLCVSPGWQMNVNVNVYSTVHVLYRYTGM